MCLAQGHNAVTTVSLEPVAPRSRVKHSATEPLQQQITEDPNLKLWNTTDIFIKMSIMEFNFRRYSMHTSLFLYVGNLILLCKLCHYIMQIAI